MSFSVDPSEVLQHLNDLGYKNISAEQLKEFIIDLKRLIKHDLKERNEATDQENGTTTSRSRRSTCSGGNISEGHRTNRSERLYLAPTLSFLQKCSMEKKTKRTPREEDQELPPVIRPSRLSSAAQRDADKKSCKMWIRPQTHRTFKSDPVSLFSNYQKDWNKFKDKIPVGNKHLDLRWAVRSRISNGRFE